MTTTANDQWGQILDTLAPGTPARLWIAAEKLAQAKGRWAVEQFERAYAAKLSGVTGKKPRATPSRAGMIKERNDRALAVLAVMPLGEWLTTAQVRDLAGLSHSTQAGNYLCHLAGDDLIERDKTNRNHFMWRRLK